MTSILINMDWMGPLSAVMSWSTYPPKHLLIRVCVPNGHNVNLRRLSISEKWNARQLRRRRRSSSSSPNHEADDSQIDVGQRFGGHRSAMMKEGRKIDRWRHAHLQKRYAWPAKQSVVDAEMVSIGSHLPFLHALVRSRLAPIYALHFSEIIKSLRIRKHLMIICLFTCLHTDWLTIYFNVNSLI